MNDRTLNERYGQQFLPQERNFAYLSFDLRCLPVQFQKQKPRRHHGQIKSLLDAEKEDKRHGSLEKHHYIKKEYNPNSLPKVISRPYMFTKAEPLSQTQTIQSPKTVKIHRNQNHLPKTQLSSVSNQNPQEESVYNRTSTSPTFNNKNKNNKSDSNLLIQSLYDQKFDKNNLKLQQILKESLDFSINSRKLKPPPTKIFQQKLPILENKDQKWQNYVDFLNKVNLSNNQIVQIPPQPISYKIYVGKGNNFAVIKNAFKRRWWWQIIEQKDYDNCNCVWTQLKQQSVLNSMISMQHEQISMSESIAHKQLTPDKDLLKILNSVDLNNYQHLRNLIGNSKKLESAFRKIKQISRVNSSPGGRCHNNLDQHFHLSNKKALFYNIRNFFQQRKEDPFQFIPVTFHVVNGLFDKEYIKFQDFFQNRLQCNLQTSYFSIDSHYFKFIFVTVFIMLEIKEWDHLPEEEKLNKSKPTNIYIIKPGEVTNRGHGITVVNEIQQISYILKQKEVHKNKNPKTYIIQLYISNPLLYNRRKFDIRCFVLATSQNGINKFYWFEEGYLRTSSHVYSLKNLQNRYIHLTNDAIQKKSEEYGKFEGGNKISFKEFNKYLQQNHPGHDLYKDLLPQMKKIAYQTLCSVYGSINSTKLDQSFEIFGLDFMIDDNFKLYLIEFNTNPCYEISSTLLARLIPNMIENTVRIAIDPIFPPPDIKNWTGGKKEYIPENIFQTNRFELLFDELSDAKECSVSKDKECNHFKLAMVNIDELESENEISDTE